MLYEAPSSTRARIKSEKSPIFSAEILHEYMLKVIVQGLVSVLQSYVLGVA